MKRRRGKKTGVSIGQPRVNTANLLFNYKGSATYAVLAIAVQTRDIMGNYSGAANTKAKWLYDSESASAESWLAANPTTHTTTQQGGAVGFFDWLNHNIVTETPSTLEIYVTAALFVVVVILAIAYRRLTRKVKEKVGIEDKKPE
jgi:hypothetical protein